MKRGIAVSRSAPLMIQAQGLHVQGAKSTVFHRHQFQKPLSKISSELGKVKSDEMARRQFH